MKPTGFDDYLARQVDEHMGDTKPPSQKSERDDTPVRQPRGWFDRADFYDCSNTGIGWRE